MTSFLHRQRGRAANTETTLMTSFPHRQRERGFWLPWIRQTQENNRTPFHNNTCQIRTGLAHTTTLRSLFALHILVADQSRGDRSWNWS